MNIGVISLGCDKNRCNTETMLHYIDCAHHQIVNDIEIADIVIVNTCAFINSAREESINTILEVAELKKSGNLKKLIVSGCLPQKYIDEIYDELPEVDAFLGTNDYPAIAKIIEEISEKRVNFVNKCEEIASSERFLTTPSHYAYLMIADGCDNKCTYCTIPQIRGKFKSRKMEELVAESKNLGDMGVKEIIFVAQDVTSYGLDLYGEIKLVELIQEISKIPEIESIRLLYCYPEKVDEKLINELKTNDKLEKYIDIPLQHASTTLLKRMGRLGTKEQYEVLFNKLKEEIPSIAIRSTVMVGFPGETEKEYNDLVDFLKMTKPINCGVFIYSDEDDAPSRKLPNKVDEKTKQDRYDNLLSILEDISYNEKKKLVGKTLRVLYEEIDFDNNRFMGRSYISAPDIDSLVFFTSKELVNVGEFVNVKILSLENDDLIGEVI